jgi:hypothetical protein
MRHGRMQGLHLITLKPSVMLFATVVCHILFLLKVPQLIE